METFPLQWLVLAAIVVWVARRALTGVDLDQVFVGLWAERRGLVLTDANRPMVRWYLHTAKTLRRLGALGGFLLPPLIGAALGSPSLTEVLVPLVFGGYLAGAVYAEVALVRPVGGTRRTATLVPRDIADYLPGGLLLAQRVVGAVAVAAGIAALVDLGGRRYYEPLEGAPPPVLAASLTVLAALLTVALVPVERWLVQRPQPFTDDDLVAADDAIRSQSVHSLAGSGLAAELLCLGGIFTALANSDLDGARSMLVAPAIACLGASLWAWLHFGHRAWRVRRVMRLGAAA